MLNQGKFGCPQPFSINNLNVFEIFDDVESARVVVNLLLDGALRFFLTFVGVLVVHRDGHLGDQVDSLFVLTFELFIKLGVYSFHYIRKRQIFFFTLQC
jgi:hypothetical protein